MISKQDIINCINNRDVFVVKDFTKSMPLWKDIDFLYDQVTNPKDLNFASFGTMVISQSEKYCNFYDDFIELFKNIHGGNLYNAMTIIHFINRTNNVINDSDAKKFSEKFYKDNSHPWPTDLKISDYNAEPREHFAPTIHCDDADGFFIQGEGETLWTIYREDRVLKEYTLSFGDMMYIPKNLYHSVESLSPRFSVSISFADINIK